MKLHKCRKAIHLLSLLLLAACAGDAWAGQTGKIAGRVTDRETKEALVGVNVVVLSTTMGGATDVGQHHQRVTQPGARDGDLSA